MNEIKRISDRCSTRDNKQSALAKFEFELQGRGYHTLKLTPNHTNRQTNNQLGDAHMLKLTILSRRQ